MTPLGLAYWVNLNTEPFPVVEHQLAIEENPARYGLTPEQIQAWRAEEPDSDSLRRRILLAAMGNYWMRVRQQTRNAGQPFCFEFIQRHSLIRHLFRIAEVGTRLGLHPEEEFEIHPMTREGLIRNRATRLTFRKLVLELGPGQEGRLEACFGQEPDRTSRDQYRNQHVRLTTWLADQEMSVEPRGTR